MPNTIAVQSSVSNVKKFLEEVSNLSTIEVCTPLGMISKSASITIPKDIDNINEIEGKDLCFVVCDSEQQKNKISTLLDDYGFEMPPFVVHLDSDDNSEEQGIEDIIEDVEERNFMFSHARSMDFVGRISETAVFSAGEIDFAEDEDEDKYEEEVSNSLTSIIDTESGNIFPKMLPHDVPGMDIVFLPATEFLDNEVDDAVLFSTVHRIDAVTMENIAPGQASVNFSKVNNGRYLVVDNAFVFSAIEGVVPGLVFITFEDKDSDNNLVPSIVMWKISHNWVEGISAESVSNNYDEVVGDITSSRYGEGANVHVLSTRDIPLPEYPFLSPSQYSKDIAVMALRTIEYVESGHADEHDDE